MSCLVLPSIRSETAMADEGSVCGWSMWQQCLVRMIVDLIPVLLLLRQPRGARRRAMYVMWRRCRAINSLTLLCLCCNATAPGSLQCTCNVRHREAWYAC